MSEERIIPTPNPATSVSCMKITPLLKPFEGDATVTATVNRDPAYTGPVTVQIRNNGFTIASLTLESPDEEEIVSLLIPAAQLSGCENKLEACATTFVSIPCCTEQISASLTARLDFGSLCPCDEPIEVALNYNPQHGRWEGVGDVYSCPETMEGSSSKTWYISLACSEECSSGWELQMSPCEGELECATSGGCSPMSLEFNASALFDCCGNTSIYGNVHVTISG